MLDKKQILSDLKKIYDEVGNFEDTVRIGTEKYNLEREEVVLMVNKIKKYYDDKESTNKDNNNSEIVYKSSFLQYFIHKNIPLIIICLVMLIFI